MGACQLAGHVFVVDALDGEGSDANSDLGWDSLSSRNSLLRGSGGTGAGSPAASASGPAANTSSRKRPRGQRLTRARCMLGDLGIRLPDEAQPLVHALRMAQLAGIFSEEQLLEVATSFSIFSEGVEDEELFGLALQRGREILTIAKLAEAFPGETREDVEVAAAELASGTDRGQLDSLDALWVRCGAASLHDLGCIDAAVPKRLSDLGSHFARHMLDESFQQKRVALAEVLWRNLSGGVDHSASGSSQGEQAVEVLRGQLSQVAFWRGARLLLSNQASTLLRERSFEDLISRSSLASLEERLGNSFAAWLSSNRVAEVAGPASFLGMTSAPRPAPPASHTLEVEILTAEKLGSPEYRVGDLTARLFASRRNLNLYVEVQCNGSTALTHVCEAAAGGGATIGETLRLDIGSQSRSGLEVSFSVRDQRGVQAAIRGDPLIGEASIALGGDDMVGARMRDIELRRQGARQGLLKCRIGVLASHADYEVLARTESKGLADVTRSLVAVLGQPQGVQALLKSRPEILQSPEVNGSASIRQLLQAWVARLQAQTLQAGASDEALMGTLARLVREAQQVVAMCAWEEASGEDIRDLTVLWIRTFFEHCAGPGGAPPALNEARLTRLLERSGAEAEEQRDDPRLALEALGVQVPEGTSEAVTRAMAERFQEAAQHDEEEMFTSEAIFVGGRVALELGAVVRGRLGGRPHVFLYDLASIRQWQRERGHDPTTREDLHASAIVPLTRVVALQGDS